MLKKLVCLAAILLLGTAGQALASTWVTDQITIDHGDGTAVLDTTAHLWTDGSKTWDETALVDDMSGIEWTYATTGGLDPSQIARHEFHIVNNTNVAWGGLYVSIFDVGTPDATILNDGFTATIPGSTLSINNPVGGNPSVNFYFTTATIAPGEAMTAMVSMSNPNQSFYGIMLMPTAVPLPGAVWLLGSGLVGLAGFRRQRK